MKTHPFHWHVGSTYFRPEPIAKMLAIENGPEAVIPESTWARIKDATAKRIDDSFLGALSGVTSSTVNVTNKLEDATLTVEKLNEMMKVVDASRHGKSAMMEEFARETARLHDQQQKERAREEQFKEALSEAELEAALGDNPLYGAF